MCWTYEEEFFHTDESDLLWSSVITSDDGLSNKIFVNDQLKFVNLNLLN